jgi:hypothetical protein
VSATTATDGNPQDERQPYLADSMVARFGSRTHLQPKELADLLGLKTSRPINRAISSGALPATVLPGCERLRFVEIDDFLIFMRANQLDDGNGTVKNAGRGNSSGNGHRIATHKHTYVVRDGRALRARQGARSV